MTDITIEKKLGRKATLVPEKIIETIQAIQAEGREATPCIIRKTIGFGGLENIGKVLKKYQKEQSSISLTEKNLIETHILSPGLEDKINMLLNDISQQVNDFSIESDQLANNLAEKKARSDYETMIDDNQKLVDEQILTIKLFDEVEVKNHELNEQISETEIKLENEKSNVIALNTSLDKANNEVTRLKQLLSEREAILSTLETKNLSFEKLITKTETQLELSIKDKEIAVNESIKIRNQLTEISSKLKSSDAIIDQLNSDINILKTEKDKSISMHQDTLSEYQLNKEKLITITTQFSAQKDVLKEKNERITDLKKQLTQPKAIK